MNQINLLDKIKNEIKYLCKNNKEQSYNEILPDIDIYFLSKEILPFINQLTNKDKIDEMTVIELSLYILSQCQASNNYIKAKYYLNN